MTVHLEARRYVGQNLGDSLAHCAQLGPAAGLAHSGWRVHDIVAWKLGRQLTALLSFGSSRPRPVVPRRPPLPARAAAAALQPPRPSPSPLPLTPARALREPVRSAPSSHRTYSDGAWQSGPSASRSSAA